MDNFRTEARKIMNHARVNYDTSGQICDEYEDAVIAGYKALLSQATQEAAEEAVQEFCIEIQRKVQLEFDAGGRYPGHLIDPWVDVARPIIYSKARLNTQSQEKEAERVRSQPESQTNHATSKRASPGQPSIEGEQS